ncbi:MAG: hypothetical protein WBD36_16715 [Bacteroidota bacterium]
MTFQSPSSQRTLQTIAVIALIYLSLFSFFVFPEIVGFLMLVVSAACVNRIEKTLDSPARNNAAVHQQDQARPAHPVVKRVA